MSRSERAAQKRAARSNLPRPETAHKISLARSSRRADVLRRLSVAEVYCAEAQRWLDGTTTPELDPGADPRRPHSEGVAKAALRDAIVQLAEVWLGLPGAEALALVRRFIAAATIPEHGRKK